MQNVLIYGGIVVNIVGAILLAVSAIKAIPRYKAAEKMPRRLEEERAKRIKPRMIALGMMLGGAIVTVIGCVI